MSMANAAATIKHARQRAGLTQAQVANRMGTTQSVVARLESSQSNPRVDTLRRALTATGHDLDLVVRSARPTVDETMIAANLRLTPAERLAHFTAAYNSIRELAPTRRDRDGSQGQASG
jgi:transcriptional regulator with XRE-family HTH domain